MSAVEEITKRALALDVKERVQLAESLLSSLPSPADWSADEEFAEAERRDREIESGQTKPIEDGEFWQRVEARRRK
jgi:hypothetical protein